MVRFFLSPLAIVCVSFTLSSALALRADGLQRPYDSRVWIALGCCCKKQEKLESAIKFFERALQTTDRDGLAVKHLAKIYDDTGNMQKAAYYYKKQLDRLDEIHGNESRDPDQIEALKKLAAYCQATGETVEAVEFYERLLTCPGSPKDFAKRQLTAIFQESKLQ